MSEDNYMSSPIAKSIIGFITGLKIMAEFAPKGLETTYFMSAEHDIIYFYIDCETIPEDSDAGRELESLGFHYDDEESGGWAYFT